MGIGKDENRAMKSSSHRTETRVTYADTDAMGVVYYAHYLRWFEMGRSELMRSLGISYREMEGEEIFLPVAEIFCKYHASARYDDVVTIETSIDSLKRASIQFRYRLVRKADGILLVTGRTLHAFVDRGGKIVRIPDGLREKIQI